jgi:phosphatidate cytidylyltransferase
VSSRREALAKGPTEVLYRRLASAGMLLLFVFGCIGLDLVLPVAGRPGWWMLPVYLVMVLGTVREMSQLLANRWPVEPIRVLMAGAVASLLPVVPLLYETVGNCEVPANCPVGGFGWIVIGQCVAVIGLGIGAMRRFSTVGLEESNPERMASIALGWLLSFGVVAYVVTPMSVWWLIRQHGGNALGIINLIGLVLVTKMADTGAYFSGKMFGKHKLSPAISPGKTVEGLIGGAIVSALAAVLYFRGFAPAFGVQGMGGTWWGPMVLGLLLTVGGVVGDLLESMIKRSVGQKDSGHQLPGLGGIWDVTDSLIPAAVIGYLGVLAGLN